MVVGLRLVRLWTWAWKLSKNGDQLVISQSNVGKQFFGSWMSSSWDRCTSNPSNRPWLRGIYRLEYSSRLKYVTRPVMPFLCNDVVTFLSFRADHESSEWFNRPMMSSKSSPSWLQSPSSCAQAILTSKAFWELFIHQGLFCFFDEFR